MRLRDLLEKIDMESVDLDAHILVRSATRANQFEEAGVEYRDVEHHEGAEVWIERDPDDDPNPGFEILPALVIG